MHTLFQIREGVLSVIKYTWKNIKMDMRANYQCYLMILPALFITILFHYVPMYGIQIAFKNYRVLQGIAGSPWVGMKHFNRFFSSHDFTLILGNTLRISLLTILFGFPAPIIFALFFNEIRHRAYQKTIQMVTYMPHFISTTVLVSMLFTMFNQRTGIINNLLAQTVGITPIPFMQSEKWFDFMYVFSGIWQNMGYSAILYIAALTAVDPALHEAAIIDGANRMQRIWHINIPSILPTIVIMLIMRTGSIINVGFEKVFLMQNTLNLNVSEVLSTYVYRLGLINNRFDYSTAVNLFICVVNCTMLLIVNTISRRLNQTSLW